MCLATDMKLWLETPYDEAPERLQKLPLLNRCFSKCLREYSVSSRVKLHIYMVTFTVRDDISDSAFDECEELVISQSKRTALKLTKFAWVKEFTKREKPHWHCLMVSTKPLKKDRFKYYENKFGKVDIAKNKAQQYHEILNYMSKSNTVTELL